MIICSVFVSDKGFQVNFDFTSQWEDRIELKPLLSQMKLIGRNPYEDHMGDVSARSAGLYLGWSEEVDTNILDQLTD